MSQTKTVGKPYLIQRCKLAHDCEWTSTIRTGQYLSLEYMGSSEFEWGAIPKFQREVNEKLSKLIEFTTVHKDVRLYFLCEPAQVNEYRQMLHDLIDNKIRTKESVRITTTWTEDPLYPLTETEVWLDLSNGLIFARKSEYLDALRITIPNSVKYMDQQNKASK